MATVKSVTIHDDYPLGDLRERRYKVTITTNSLVDEEYILSPVVVDVSDDGSIYGDRKLASLADIEAGSGADIIAEYQDQSDYDRRALGKMMLLEDVHEVHSVLPLFKSVEVRGGANANQRAVYLEVSRANYDLVANRMNDIEGVQFFLTDAKSQIWEAPIPAEFE